MKLFLISDGNDDDIQDSEPLPIHWSVDPKQVAEFFADCKKLDTPPTDKETIYTALEIGQIGEYSNTRAEALKTVKLHMQELSRIEGEKSLQDIDDTLAPSYEVGHVETPYSNRYPKLEVKSINLDGTYECEITLTNGNTETVTKTYTQISKWKTGKPSDTPYGKKKSTTDEPPKQEALLNVPVEHDIPA